MDNEDQKKINEILGHFGHMIGSKTNYFDRHPTHLIAFNANLFTRKFKFWYGDLDITLSLSKLIEVAKIVNTTIYVFKEMDGRFEEGINPDYTKAILTIAPDGVSTLNSNLTRYYGWNGEKWQGKSNK